MVDVAQLVRAPVCGTGGRGFKSRHPPHIKCLELLGDFPLISKHFYYNTVINKTHCFCSSRNSFIFSTLTKCPAKTTFPFITKAGVLITP